jgi:hypothetical protein
MLAMEGVRHDRNQAGSIDVVKAPRMMAAYFGKRAA